jgi:hypothetical protein
MAFLPPYPWYFDPLPMAHHPHPWHFDTYSWYIGPLTSVIFISPPHGILTSLPMCKGFDIPYVERSEYYGKGSNAVYHG